MSELNELPPPIELLKLRRSIASIFECARCDEKTSFDTGLCSLCHYYLENDIEKFKEKELKFGHLIKFVKKNLISETNKYY